ncbi:hypothetical protein KKF61_02065 [Patescibacteria group bacterium]|nr:hypothetical protein [Patescibacteria group bacterium]MBU0963697.1 hypothetical protein [Patescibacteria group bacterium]
MKDFLKPTIVKIILALLIPLFLGLEVLLSNSGEAAGGLTYSLMLFPYPWIVMLILLTFIMVSGPIDTLNSHWSYFSNGQKIWVGFLELIIPLVIAYILACLIAYGLKKLHFAVFKKKPESEEQ